LEGFSEFEWEIRAAHFSMVRDRIRRLLLEHPNLTVEELDGEFIFRYGLMADIRSRLRELQADGIVESVSDGFGVQRWRLVEFAHTTSGNVLRNLFCGALFPCGYQEIKTVKGLRGARSHYKICTLKDTCNQQTHSPVKAHKNEAK
jgi:hypothetical protein